MDFDAEDLVTVSRVTRQRRWAMFHLMFAAVRVASWSVLIAMYFAGVPFTSALFRSVAFVAVVSLYANAMTDLGIALAAYAGVIAADARRDVHGTSDRLLRQILATAEAIEDRIERGD